MITKNEYFPQTVSHPGKTLNEKLEELEMSHHEFAMRVVMNEKVITDIINGESPITTEIALLFENILQIPAHFWINRQKKYDESIAKNITKNILNEDKQIYKFV